MKLVGVTLSNYGSFQGEHTFSIADRGLVFINGDNRDEPRMSSNGGGKSTLFDSVDWCLFGEVPKGDHSDSIVNDSVGKKCVVTVHLLDEVTGQDATVVRKRKPNGLTFHEGTQDKTQMDAKATQEKIESFLGLDRRVFHAAVYRAQGDEFDFANATDSEKKELLSKIIPELQEVDELRIRTQALVAETKVGLDEIDREDVRTQTAIEILGSKDWAAQEASWQQSIQVRIDAALADIEQQQAHVDAYAEQLGHEDVLKDKLAQLQTAPTGQAVEHTAQNAAQAHQAEVQRLHSEWGISNSELQRAQQQRTKLDRLASGECPTCAQPLTAEHLDAEKARLDAVAAEQQEKAEVASVVLGTARGQQAALDAQAAQEVQRNQEQDQQTSYALGQAQSQLDNLAHVLTTKQQLERDILRKEGTIDLIRAEVWPGAAQRDADQAQLFELRANQVVKTTERGELTTRMEHLTFWVDAFGLKGLKSLILDSRLQTMTDAANEWVKVMTGGTHWVRFESQTMSRSGKLAEKFNVRVFKHNPDGTISDRNYRSFSGGEKRRIALGIDWGLSCLVAGRASKQWDVSILDECFKHLDSEGRAAFFDLLEILQRERSSLFVIDHSVELASAFENTITIRKEGGRSTIVEERAVQESAA